jgi:zinc/manganese transport system substrate-binding protein
MPGPPPRSLVGVLATLLAAAALLIGCGGSDSVTSAPSGKLNVVAAEDFWGSVAAQLGGDRVQVTSIITNPAADPHDYEPTSEDARELAGSQVAIVNGIGYDEWASKLLAANESGERTELVVGDVLGLEAGDNPHQWYSPGAVERVSARIIADFERADPGHDAYYAARQRGFETVALGRYHRLIAAIRRRFGGTAVGASESIFEPLAQALGLSLITPRGFLDAVAEGTEPTPADKATTDDQIAARQLKVWVYNSQNATPDVQRLNDAARATGVPVATVTETLTPEGAGFQDWMSRQLKGLRAALSTAAGS